MLLQIIIVAIISLGIGTLIGDDWFHLLNKLLTNHTRMKKFEIKAVRLQDLINVIASTSPAEVQKEMPAEPVKTISRLEAIFTDLEKANKEYADVFAKFIADRDSVGVEFTKKIDEKKKELANATDEEIANAVNELVQ